jgi:hypothetical protein
MGKHRKRFEEMTTDELRGERWRLYFSNPKTEAAIFQKGKDLARINTELYQRTGNDAYLLYRVGDGY